MLESFNFECVKLENVVLILGVFSVLMFVINYFKHGRVRGAVDQVRHHGKWPAQMLGQHSTLEKQIWQRLHAYIEM